MEARLRGEATLAALTGSQELVPVVNVAGSENLTVLGSGFLPGVDDYTCRFRTDLMICPMLPASHFPSRICGEVEVRETTAVALTSFEIACTTPSKWDLASMHVRFEVAKAGYPLRGDGFSQLLYFQAHVTQVVPTRCECLGMCFMCMWYVVCVFRETPRS